MKRRKPTGYLSDQIRKYADRQPESGSKGGDGQTISTGSTLLDLAISGGRSQYGGIPVGILVEIFGPAGSGKTVLLCELAGDIQRKKGQVMFLDPEGRLNKLYASVYGLEMDHIEYGRPDTVPALFEPVRVWKPEPEEVAHGIFADSLAALSTQMEMDSEDKMGMRRAKEFSEQLRKTCRTLANKELLMVCSNQVRQTQSTYGPKYKSPGGEAIGFYSSLRLHLHQPQKLRRKRKIYGKEQERVFGIKTEVEIHKSTVWEPYNKAPIYIVFDYGIDDIRGNLQYLKDNLQTTTYTLLDGEKIGASIEKAIKVVEKKGLALILKRDVIRLWNDIQSGLRSERKPKER